MDSFIFKGINSTSFSQIVINSIPPVSKPPKRTNKIQMDGKDGDITEFLGYEAYEKEIQITILENTNIDDLIEWLNGSGELVLSNEPNKYYKAEIISQIDFPRLVKYEKIKVKFHCQPFKYLLNEEEIESNTLTNVTITNQGNTEAKPVITIYGENEIKMYINNIQIFKIELGNEGYLTIDAEKMEAYKDTLDTLKNRLVTGNYDNFELKQGINTISFEGNVTKYKISNYSRWI